MHESWLKRSGKESTITLVVKNVEVGETEESHNPDSEDDEINFELRTEVFDEESLTWRTSNWGHRVESDEFSQLVNPQCRRRKDHGWHVSVNPKFWIKVPTLQAEAE
ncbi:hypothetical protein NE237_000420 [Protea cynaroides]|uniref:Uncharacterized protein n=1 Tax=Protea cynaroides TaxID=273540 RepID=A0A9Q0QXG6_9MAGN|nr:hypothetical protein NE237_000420 [Protea cynaroides]